MQEAERYMKAIVAVDSEMGMADSAKNEMPWTVPEEMRNFTSKTVGGVVVMGRKTYQTLNRPLADREMIILGSRTHEAPVMEGCSWLGYASVEGMFGLVNHFEHANGKSEKPIWVIGGAETFRSLEPWIGEVHLSRLSLDYGLDVKFPIDLSRYRTVTHEGRTYFPGGYYESEVYAGWR